jgi:regulator of protease activity HflC (stomatin/prohibitin superfamily)
LCTRATRALEETRQRSCGAEPGDKVSIRVNVWTEFQVADAVKAKESVKDYAKHLYRTVQLGVRQALGRRTLEETRM